MQKWWKRSQEYALLLFAKKTEIYPDLTPDPASGEIVARRRTILGDCAPRVGELLPDSHFSEAITSTFFFHAGDRFVKYLVDLQRLHRRPKS